MLYLGPRVRSARLMLSLPLRTIALLSPLPIALDACVALRWQVVRTRNALFDLLTPLMRASSWACTTPCFRPHIR